MQDTIGSGHIGHTRPQQLHGVLWRLVGQVRSKDPSNSGSENIELIIGIPIQTVIRTELTKASGTPISCGHWSNSDISDLLKDKVVVL